MNFDYQLSKQQTEIENQAYAWFLGYCDVNSLELDKSYWAHLFSVACWMVDQTKTSQECLTFGVSGGQGSGKSTFSNLLAILAKQFLAMPTEVLSLDDFYLSRIDRLSLAEKVHPLLLIRGAPGSHAVNLFCDVVADLKARRATQIPVFHKGDDDRTGYRTFNADFPRILILEGWCWGAAPVSSEALIAPINALEKEDDADGRWRIYVNDALGHYQTLFQTDYSIFLKVPDMAAVLRWRWQQEQALDAGKHKMSYAEVERFIMFYQRITERLLTALPQTCDLTLHLDPEHHINSVSQQI